VGLGHGLDDGQAQPGPVAGLDVRPSRVLAEEAAEGVLGVEEARPAVGDTQDEVAVLERGRHHHLAPGGRELDPVLHQIPRDLSQEPRVDCRDRASSGPQVENDVLLLCTAAQPVHHAGHDGSDLHGLEARLHGPGVGAGENQEVFGDARQAGDLFQRALDDPLVLVGVTRPAQRELELPAHRGQGRAQLVAGIGREATLGLEGVVDSLQHPVQDLDEPPVLPHPGIGLDATVQRATSNRQGLVDDLVHGTHGSPCQPPRPGVGRRRHHQREEGEEARHPGQHLVAGRKRGGDLEHVPLVGHPEALQRIVQRPNGRPLPTSPGPDQRAVRSPGEVLPIQGQVGGHEAAAQQADAVGLPDLSVTDQVAQRGGLVGRELPLVEVHLSRGGVGEGGRLNRSHVQDRRVDLRVQHRAEGEERDGRHRHHARDHGGRGPERELEAERAVHRDSDCPKTYPTPRIVWISGSPPASRSF
jgi:hypothetical protein